MWTFLRGDPGVEAGFAEVNKGNRGLIGANGAGKSTLLMSVFGQPRIRNGQILFCGEDISHKSTHYVTPAASRRHLRDDAFSRICL